MRTIEDIFMTMSPGKKLKLAWLLITCAVIDIIANSIIWLVGGRRRS